MNMRDIILARAMGGGSGGGVSSWNDFGSEVKETVWLEETTFEFTEEQSQMLVEGKTIQPGATYKVTWDGVEYSCIAKSLSVGGMQFVCFGNVSVFGEEDTGEPFACAYAPGQGAVITGTGILTGEYTGKAEIFHIIEIAEVVTPVPAKFLTNAMPYYVDILYDGDSTYTCNESAVSFKEAFRSGRQIIARIIQYSDNQGTIYTHAYMDGCAVDVLPMVWFYTIGANRKSIVLIDSSGTGTGVFDVSVTPVA
jgi:hypothetical protein